MIKTKLNRTRWRTTGGRRFPGTSCPVGAGSNPRRFTQMWASMWQLWWTSDVCQHRCFPVVMAFSISTTVWEHTRDQVTCRRASRCYRVNSTGLLLPVCLSVCLSVCMSIMRSITYLPVCLSDIQSLFPFVCLFSPFVFAPVCLYYSRTFSQVLSPSVCRLESRMTTDINIILQLLQRQTGPVPPAYSCVSPGVAIQHPSPSPLFRAPAHLQDSLGSSRVQDTRCTVFTRLSTPGDLHASPRFPSLPDHLESPGSLHNTAEVQRHVSYPVLPGRTFTPL